MTEEIEKKAEEYTKECEVPTLVGMIGRKCDKVKRAYKDGYEQGVKDNCETHKECQFLKYLEKENEELKAKLSSVYNCLYCGCSNCDVENCQIKRS